MKKKKNELWQNALGKVAAYILSNINFHDNSGTTHLYDRCMVLKLNFKHEMLK